MFTRKCDDRTLREQYSPSTIILTIDIMNHVQYYFKFMHAKIKIKVNLNLHAHDTENSKLT